MQAGGHIKQPFMASLNVGEVELLQAYAAKHPDQAWQLNQNPKAGHGMNSNDKWLHTLIHNCGLTFDLTLAIDPPVLLSHHVNIGCQEILQPLYFRGHSFIGCNVLNVLSICIFKCRYVIGEPSRLQDTYGCSWNH